MDSGRSPATGGDGVEGGGVSRRLPESPSDAERAEGGVRTPSCGDVESPPSSAGGAFLRGGFDASP